MTALSLTEWVDGAVGRGDDPLTPAYLASALRIAKHLTEQIGDAEELSKVGLSSGLDSLPLPYPYTCQNWADCIKVNIGLEQLNNHAFAPPDDGASLADEDEFKDQIDDLVIEEVEYDDIDDELLSLNLPEEQNGEEGAKTKTEGIDHSYDKSGLDYHNVLSAEILESISDLNLSATNCADDKNDAKLQRIYSLGLALHFLFSGGDLPPPEMLVIHRQDGSFSAMSVNSHQDDDESGASPSSKRRVSMSGSTIDSSEGSRNSRVVNNMNFEYLRMKGVPGPLCDLIHNMIDCINGDFVGDETYTDVSDITCDLQLMINEPEIYLNGVDASELARTGLQLDDTLFERSAKLHTLQAAYAKSALGSCEVAILCGSSGTGKSTIANQFGKFVTSSGGHFISCKFDQMREVEEFSPIASAFNKYVDLLITNEVDQARLLALDLCDVLGQDIYHLLHVIPSLQDIISPDMTTARHVEQYSDEEYANAQQRHFYLVSKFVDVICRCSSRPLALFVDDVQWADTASIFLIEKVLKASASVVDGKRLFFLACYRDDEMQDDHPFWNVHRSICSIGYASTRVELESVDSETVKQALSRLLHLAPRLVGSLSDIICRKTKGNPLFLMRLLRSLNQDGLLRINLFRHRWEWNESAIRSRKLPDDVAVFFIQQISSLPTDCASALATLSCFGASVSCNIVEAMEQNLAMQLTDPLESAIKAGLLDKRDEKYHFPHDRIQEAAYASIGEAHRSLYHMIFGLCLVDFAKATDDDSVLFLAVTQINIAGPSAVINDSFFAAIAEYNLSAGKKAMSLSQFSSALRYFEHGMTFLRKKHWHDHYDLWLKLFHFAARCALAINDFTSLEYLCSLVSQRARNFDDTLDTSLIMMISLIHSKLSESIGYGTSILLKLGVCLPEFPQRDHTINRLDETRIVMNLVPDEVILGYPIMSDYKKVMAMKFMARLISPLGETRPMLLPLIAIKMVNFTVEHGLSSMSSVGFALFGNVVAKLGNLKDGYRYTKLALSLLDKFKITEVIAEVTWISVQVMSYIGPYSDVRLEVEKGLQASMSTGNIHLACLYRMSDCFTMFWFGVGLKDLKGEFDDFARFMQEQMHQTFFTRIEMYQHYVCKLMEDDSQPKKDGEFDMNLSEMHPINLISLNFIEMFSSLVFNKYDDMKSYGVEFKEIDSVETWYLVSCYSFRIFFIGLVFYHIFRETHEPIWAEKAKEYEGKIKLWSEQGSARTFEHMHYLMQAEEAYSYQDEEKAQELYNRAILSAKRNDFIRDCALACDLAGHFYLKMGNASCAFKYYTMAYWKYTDWGAAAKCRQMEEFSWHTFNAGFPAEADDEDFIVDDNNDCPVVTRKRERL